MLETTRKLLLSAIKTSEANPDVSTRIFIILTGSSTSTMLYSVIKCTAMLQYYFALANNHKGLLHPIRRKGDHCIAVMCCPHQSTGCARTRMQLLLSGSLQAKPSICAAPCASLRGLRACRPPYCPLHSLRKTQLLKGG